MNLRTISLAAAAVLMLAACGQRDADKTDGVISTLADNVAAEVREEMSRENFGLDGPAGLPKAELTPEGDLVIDGRPVALSAEQRAVALAYREGVIAIAQQGARVGLQGADVAKDAAAAAIAGVLGGGDPAKVDAAVEASANRVRAEARKLCDELPGLMAKQQALAKAVPEFAPYADMTQADIDECMHEGEATTP
jgi:hypothetical protein